MVAPSTAREIVTFVVVLAVVGSVVTAPVAAGDDSISAVDDEEPIDVSTDNESVETDVVDETATAVDEADTDETTDAVIGGVSDSGTANRAPVGTTADDEELPVDYSDIPFWLLQGEDLCDPAVDPTDPPGPPVDPTDPPEPVPPAENPTPLNPNDPPGAPFGHCDVFDPYDPAFDPTDLPDDPQYDHSVRRSEAGEDGVYVGAEGEASPDSEWPGVDTTAGVRATQDGVMVIQLTNVDEGNRESTIFSDARLYPGARSGELRGWSVVFDRNARTSVICNGEVCVVDAPAPAPDPEVPTNRSDDGDEGGDDEEQSVPCQPPVGPGDAPEAPLGPVSAPEAPLGPCGVYDPNDPPNPSSAPEYNVYETEVGPDAVVAGVAATLDGGPTVNAITGVTGDEEEIRFGQSTYLNDGQKSYVSSARGNVEPGSATDAGLEGVHLKGDTAVQTRAFGEYAGLTVACDGEFCTVGSESLPVGDRQVRIANSSGSDSSSQQTATTAGTSDSDDGAIDAGSTAGPVDRSSDPVVDPDPSTPTTPAPADRPVAPPFPVGFSNGPPDVATATETLLELV